MTEVLLSPLTVWSKSMYWLLINKFRLQCQEKGERSIKYEVWTVFFYKDDLHNTCNGIAFPYLVAISNWGRGGETLRNLLKIQRVDSFKEKTVSGCNPANIYLWEKCKHVQDPAICSRSCHHSKLCVEGLFLKSYRESPAELSTFIMTDLHCVNAVYFFMKKKN